MRTQTRPDKDSSCKNCTCNKTRFFDFLRNFPTTGRINTLYVDKSTGNIYIWDGSNYITTELTSINYADLETLIDGSLLQPGKSYIISDYRTVHTIPETVDTNTGDLEPLIVTAIKNNELAPIAYSTVYPDDIVYYSPGTDETNFPGAVYGYIRRRILTTSNIDIGNDWRACKYRRYKLNVTTEWDSVTAYTQLAVVKKTGTEEIYIAIRANTNVALTETGTWMRYPYDNTTYNGHPSAGLVNVPYDSNDYLDAVLFRNGLTNNVDIYISHIGLYNSHFPTAFNFKVNGIFVRNTIGSATDVDITGSFYDNIIGTSFNKNKIGATFDNNTIGNIFYSNQINSDFRTNLISNNFISNFMQGFFKSNKIGFSTYSNKFLDEFGSNVIGNSSSFNCFHVENKNNIIGNNFVRNNTCPVMQGIDFTSATHAYANYTKNYLQKPDGTYVLEYVDNGNTKQIVAANS